MSSSLFAAGDLVCIPSLPRQTTNTSCIWKPDPRGSFLGIVVDVKMSDNYGLNSLKERVTVKLANGELITLSTNMIEPVQPGTQS